MVIGPFINASAVLLGGVLGAVLSQRLPERIRSSMPSIFGLASLGIGILLVIKCANLPVMVLATLLGALIGEFCYLEKGINGAVGKAKNLISRGKNAAGAHDSFIQSYVAIIILFCASGTGIFGSMQEGMTGDPSILIAKAFLDFFTATIFATTLGIAVAAISVPMLLIQLALATCATLILPLTTPAMMADFTAVGGLLLLATGLRICGIKMFAVVNMLPALIIAMPLSALWTAFFA
ncbi:MULTISPECIES: DUF554 domain-containing protein [Leclercia]|uniref:DUF554 domain-containing protein n=1 Tax=Leclercia pneumoniae TaxID=2815358 RepID=A0ABX8JWR5_9ENTR|nr:MULTISPECIES: DUF554 domain-containing protein [Leclercia]KGB03110.1 hypothetical protein DR73_2791 [Enterobacteriaceae bacterium ATCC 29904]KKY79870.1 membrane protein [Enterobacter cloacae]MBM6607126.1 DUF554 domain-containing protein [Enterobacteriaceae bacterium RIT 814]MBS0851140.1 DUF554 domain-containing protein [Enterobacter sp. JGM127]MCE6962531.1 DUF554 domain-containing protein [Enterobacter sp. MW07]